MTFKLEHVHVKTKDPDATAKFYIDVLGATLVERTGANSGYRLKLDGLMVNVTGLIPYQDRPQILGIEHIALETFELDKDVKKLTDNGAKVLLQMENKVLGHGLRVCFIECPDGVQLEIIEKRPS